MQLVLRRDFDLYVLAKLPNSRCVKINYAVFLIVYSGHTILNFGCIGRYLKMKMEVCDNNVLDLISIPRTKILAPVHNIPTIEAAVRGGADEVYFGLDIFSMRKDVVSFTLKDLSKVVDTCHDYGLKANLTTNTVVYDSEMGRLQAVLEEAKKSNIDAIIIQDLAAMKIARELGLDFHVSTMCNICNISAADIYTKLGASRLILARELSLSQIHEIAKAIDAEIEVFVHGAMCFAFSGRCNFSQFFTGKLDNRGKCAQPCRRSWRLVDTQNTDIIFEEGHFFSAKDLCYIEHVPKLIEAGASVFKIEGRRRPPEYVEVTSRCYREAVDAWTKGTFTTIKVIEWLKQLRSVFNRGFGKGFLYEIPGSEDSTNTIPFNKATKERTLVGEVVKYDFNTKRANIFLNYGELKVTDGVIVEGPDTYCNLQIDSFQVQDVQYRCASVGTEAVITSVHPLKKGDKVYAWRVVRSD